MTYNIHIALERLEQNLQDLQSAKEQVNSVVTSNMQLQEVVKNYVTTAGSIMQETLLLKKEVMKIKDFKELEIKQHASVIDNACSKIIAEFQDSTGATIESLHAEKNKITQLIDEWQRIIHHTEEEITELKEAKELEIKAHAGIIEKACSEVIAGFQHSTNDTIESLHAERDKLTQLIDEWQRIIAHTEEEIQTITKYTQDTTYTVTEQLLLLNNLHTVGQKPHKTTADTQNAINNLFALSQQTDNTANETKQTVNDLFFICKKIDDTASEIHSMVNHLHQEMIAQHAKSRKNIRINRWIYIVGISIIAALHLVYITIHYS